MKLIELRFILKKKKKRKKKTITPTFFKVVPADFKSGTISNLKVVSDKQMDCKFHQKASCPRDTAPLMSLCPF